MSRGGEEYQIAHGDYSAVVTEVGGGLRRLRHGDRDLLLGYEDNEVRPRFRGSLLAPWPNRVVDGRYSFAGSSYQLDITEPQRQHALHGLVCWARFDLLDSDASSVVVGHRLVPQTGYPFELEVVAHYALGDDGLTCSVSARNIGAMPAPFGLASHPYLVPGPGTMDEWTLDLPAQQVQGVTSDRLLPASLSAVEDGDLDFRDGRRLGDTEVDHAFTALVPGLDGLVRARVRADGGTGVECEWDPTTMAWVQVHTADLPDPAHSRRGLALEPMTCPPDAFNSGTDLIVLEPEAETRAAWTLRVL
ncbi:MAG: aldose 1-epimerase family protein [Nocardioidaceae bacterium]|nr:aldose 1-epimerase family protein [Nocardioidaceae bacterium]